MRTIQRLIFGIICCVQGVAFADTTEIFVRLNSDPFTAPHYIFSNTENGDPITPELVRGSTYVFTRTDSGHAFNIGAGWRSADSNLTISSTGTDYAVSDVASIESGQKLTVEIPSDFSGSTITYYCYLHSSMVSTISVVDPAPVDPTTLDTDSDGIPDVNDADDDGDGVIDSLDPWPLDDYYSADYDKDGMPDLFENFHGLDAASDDSAIDTDSDGLTNLEEFTYKTDPRNKDTDLDSISDGVEIQFSRDPLIPDIEFAGSSRYFCSKSDLGNTCHTSAAPEGLENMRAFDSEHWGGAMCAIDGNDVVCWGPGSTSHTSSSYGVIEAAPIINTGEVSILSRTALDQPAKLSAAPSVLDSGVLSRAYPSGWCAIDKSGVFCNGSRHSSNEAPYDDPISVSTNGSEVCIIYSGPNLYKQKGKTSELFCDGPAFEDGTLEVPSISNPKSVDIGGHGDVFLGAVISNSETVVFTKQTIDKPGRTELSNPRQVSVANHHYCVLHEDGVYCRAAPNVTTKENRPRENYWREIGIPFSRENPARLFVTNRHTCVLYRSGIFCTGFDGMTGSVATYPYGKETFNPFWIAKRQYSTLSWTTNIDHYAYSTFPEDTGGGTGNPESVEPYLDVDKDGYKDSLDVFPLDASEWLDTDGDLTGNNADTDDDNDGIADATDAKPLDTDNDGIDNVTDDDDDGDGVKDTEDTYPLDTDNDAQHNGIDEDDDNDGYADKADAFILDSSEWLDTDGDGIGNNADADDDNDGLNDSADQFPLDSSEQVDSDGDGVGNNADQMPFDATETLDTDADGIGNNADTDDDGDGLSDAGEIAAGTEALVADTDGDGTKDGSDALPLDSTESVDTDKDGIGNNADTDDDGDGVEDSSDAFPLDSDESIDTDSDGIGNNADLDDDGDSFSDEQEAIDGTDPLSRFSCRSGCFSFDVDQSSSLNALTDGLLVMRHLFDFSGDTLVANATDASATRSVASDITSYLTDAQKELDIDGNGEVGALTDGLLLIRYLFDFRGESLINNAVDANATRKTAAEIEAYIQARIPGA